MTSLETGGVAGTPTVRSRRPRLSRTRYLRRAKMTTTMITMRTTVPIPIYMGCPWQGDANRPVLPGRSTGRAQRGKDGGDQPVR